MASSKATGASALLGVVVDAPSDLYAVGRPGIDLGIVAAPTTSPTAAAGGAGLLTGSFGYRVAYGQPNGALTPPSPFKTTVGNVTISHLGLDDLAAAGTYTGAGYPVFDVQIDANGSPDTFKWNKNGGTYTSSVACTLAASPTTLSDGVTVAFGSVTGHTAPGWSISTAAVGTPDGPPATGAGTYSASTAAVFDIVIDDAADGPATFKWRETGGTGSDWTFTVPTTDASPITLIDGVTVTFTTPGTFGFTLGDSWKITVAPVPPDEWHVIAAQTVVALSNQMAHLTSVPTSGDPSVDRRVFERTSDGGATWVIAGTLYDNSTAEFYDNGPVLDTSKRLPTSNQTGANYGFTFLEPDSFDLEPEFSNLKVVALLGTAGSPRAIPGNIKIADTPKSDLRPADMLPILLAGAGVPDSYTQIAGEPTQIATWAATTGKRNPRTISALAYQGSSNVPPNFLYQIATDELDFTFANGKIESIAPKFTGTNFGTSAPAVQISGTGTWAGTFAAIGQRYDANALTDSVFVKITQALSGDTVKFKVSVDTHASAGGGSYGSEYTLYVNDTSKNQTKGGLQYNDAIELMDQTGLYLGADVGSNRQPFLLVATAPLTTDLNVGDIYELLPSAAIPGVGAAPYSGVPARFAQGPRFTDAHITLYQDGNVIEATSGTLKLMWPKKAVSSLCAGARTVIDMPNEGFFGASMTIARYLDATTYRQIIRTDSRAHINIALVGERIPVNPGVLSTYRESLIMDFPQVVLESVKAPVTGQVLVVESISAAAEQPDDSSKDLYTMTLTTRQGWRLPS